MNAMTITESERPRLRPVTFDAYRDIHKGIRAELFEVTTSAGRVDVADTLDLAALAAHVGAVARLLAEHADHEDVHVQHLLEAHFPALAGQVERDHASFDTRIAQVAAIADEVCGLDVPARRGAVHELYIELALFVSGYLAHQDLEERIIMPALEDAIGVDAVIGIHMAIIGSLSPEEMTRGMAAMLPALNVDDRTEMLGGIRAGAPAEAFDGVWSLTRSVLPSVEVAKVATRLGLSA
jgi:hypothetical protein